MLHLGHYPCRFSSYVAGYLGVTALYLHPPQIARSESRVGPTEFPPLIAIEGNGGKAIAPKSVR